VIERVTVGATVLMASFAAGAGLIRWAVSPAPARGRHRGRRTTTVLDRASLDELLGPWPMPAPAAVVAQGWRWCPSCVREEPSVLHRNGWTCGHCFEVTYVGGAR
jgi:hypothetical protein